MSTPTFDSARRTSLLATFPDTAPFWEAAAEGQLLIKSCRACGEAHYFPRSICPFCGSDRTEWKRSSGRGQIYSVSVSRRGPRAPYAIAYVTLTEGVTMMSNIVDCDLDRLGIGDEVEVVFRPTDDGVAMPMFRPASVLPGADPLGAAT